MTAIVDFRHPGVLITAALLTALLASSGSAAEATQASDRAWTPPRTPEGHPDLQGIWTSGTATPFERPADLSTERLTKEQAAALEQRTEDNRTHKSIDPNEVGHDNEAFIDVGYKVLPSLQPSLIVLPSDGRVQLTAEAERRRDYNLTRYDSYESMSPWDRCITRGPTGLLPASYNNGYQIVQNATHVLIFTEMVHEARAIPIDGGAHADSRIRTWSGDSRGRWEGATLVVDTTNFHDRGWLTTHTGSGRVRGVPHSEALHIVERFTRVGDDGLQYEITIDDPPMFASPWTAKLVFERDEGYRIYEYACHEGNQATELILRGERVQEQRSSER